METSESSVCSSPHSERDSKGNGNEEAISVRNPEIPSLSSYASSGSYSAALSGPGAVSALQTGLAGGARNDYGFYSVPLQPQDSTVSGETKLKGVKF